MKRTAVIVGLGLFLALPSWMMAQERRGAMGENHGEIGAYFDYMRWSPANTTTNFVGVGGRLSFNFHPNVALEGEMNYDFARDYTTTTNNTVSSTVVRSSVRPLSGLFGPRFQLGRGGPMRIFATGKVGFIEFSAANAKTLNGTEFGNAINGVGGSSTHFAMYPGGGIEGFIGPVGLRLEAGDQMYLDSGVKNNLKVTLGPEIRW